MATTADLDSFERCERCFPDGGPRNETTRSKYVSAARRCAIGGEPENNRDRRAAMNHYRRHLAEHVTR